MPRARNIKPGFFQNEDLSDLPFEDRLFFIGLWTIADYKGCLEYRPRRLRVTIMPFDNFDVEKAVQSLTQARFIRTYSRDNQEYIKIINFERHQRPHKNEVAGGSPIPDENDPIPEVPVTQQVTESPNKSGSSPNKSEPLALNTDSLNIDSLNTNKTEEAMREVNILTAIRKEFLIKKLSLSDSREWTQHAALAFENDYTPDQFLECLSLLRRQKWRTSAVKPKHVTENLPNLEKVRSEVNADSQNHHRQNQEPLRNINDLNAERKNRPLPQPPPSKSMSGLQRAGQDNSVAVNGTGQAH